MKKCKICGCTFDVPDLIDEGPQDSSWPTESRLHTEVCPYCGSEDIEEAYPCRICGESIIEGEFCWRCKGTVQESLRALAQFLQTDDDTIDDAIVELKGW